MYDLALQEPAWLTATVGVCHSRAVLQGHLGACQGQGFREMGRAEAVRARDPQRGETEPLENGDGDIPETKPPQKGEKHGVHCGPEAEKHVQR